MSGAACLFLTALIVLVVFNEAGCDLSDKLAGTYSSFISPNTHHYPPTQKASIQ